jgi:Ca-activated chloride channel homolog
MKVRTSIVALVVFAAVPLSLPAQILVPQRPVEDPQVRPPRHPPIRRLPRPIRPPVWSSYQIRAVDVQADVKNQAAKVRMSQVFENTGEVTVETQFLFPIPEDAAVSDLTLLYDGKELPGRLLNKDDARRVYEEIVRRQRDPALLEYMGHGLFQTSVFPIPPHAQRTVEIRYSQLLRKDNGLIDFLLPLGTFKHNEHPIERLDVAFRLETSDPIKTIYSPTHSVAIERPDDHHAACKLTLNNVQSPDDLRILCGTHAGPVGMSVVSFRPKENEDGYFMLLASPELKAPQTAAAAKTVVIVVDRSGSMSGEKIEQARQAVRFLVQQLKPDDTFNIIAYDTEVDAFRPELQRVKTDTINAALSFASGLNAGGGTNIDSALTTALAMLVDAKRPNYVLFLTDGQPTVGEQNEIKIVADAQAADKVHARIFNLGIGYDVNARLLDRLSRELGGQSVYVRPNENIETYVSTLAKAISSPLLTDLNVKFAFDSPQPAGSAEPISRTYPRRLTDLFAGEQLVWVGRYRKSGPVKVSLSGLLGEKRQTFSTQADLAERSVGDSNSFVAKVWATRRIGELIDEIDLHGQNQELVNELVELSKKHGIMTPYTSFLADEHVDIADRLQVQGQAVESLMRLEEKAGEAGVAQRRFKGNLQAAPRAPVTINGAMGDKDVDVDGLPAAKGISGAQVFKTDTFGGRARNRRGQTSAGSTLSAQTANSIALPAVVDGKSLGELKSKKNPIETIGEKTFYWKNDRWRDADVTADGEKNPIRIKPFSDEYFALAAKENGRFAKCLALDGPVLIVLDGKTYLIEAASGS